MNKKNVFWVILIIICLAISKAFSLLIGLLWSILCNIFTGSDGAPEWVNQATKVILALSYLLPASIVSAIKVKIDNKPDKNILWSLIVLAYCICTVIIYVLFVPAMM